MNELSLARSVRRIAHRHEWLPAVDLHEVVDVIRQDDNDASDNALRTLIHVRHRDAMTVAMHALAPRVRAKVRDNDHEYVQNVYGDLAMVLAEGPHDGERLARRLVGRAHKRTYASVRRVTRKGASGQVHVIPVADVKREVSQPADVDDSPLNDSPLSERDRVLIEATRVRGLPLTDVALLLGMTYEQAKKRRQRAEAEWYAWRRKRVHREQR
jgi:hypothetical protein